MEGKQADCKISMPKYTNSLLMDIHLLQLESTLCDVKLQTNNGEILAHRLVLIAASPYFRERLLFTKTEDGVVTLYIEDTDHTTMNYMVNFFYSGNVQVPSENLESFVKLCDQLMLPKLADLCLTLLGKLQNKNAKERVPSDGVCKTEICEDAEINQTKPASKHRRKRKKSDSQVPGGPGMDADHICVREVSLKVPKLSIRLAGKGRKKNSSGTNEKLKSKVGRKSKVANDSDLAFNSTVANKKANFKTVNRKSGKLKTSVSVSFKNVKNIPKSNGLAKSKESKGPSLKMKVSKENIVSKDTNEESSHGYTDDAKQESYCDDEEDDELNDESDSDDQEKSDELPLATEVDREPVRTKLKARFPKQCNVCKEMLRNYKDYTEHMKTHKRTALKGPRRVRKGGWPCSVCGRVLTSAVRQACHQNSKHGVPYDPQYKLHVCTYEGCNYTTASKHYLQIHTAGRHSDARPHVCEFCGKGFKLPSALITHLNIHTNAKIYQCQECDLTFNQKGGLDIHVKKHHKGQESWTELCHLCSEKFLHKAELCWHLYQVHQIPVPDRYNVFSCELCDYQTIRKNKLERHMDAHDDKRTFICNICGKKFVTKSYLNRHVKYHGEKSFKCDFEGCNYACVDKLGLRKHIRLMHTHKNYKPFLCSICPYKTGLRGNLDKHIRTVHNLEVVTKHTVHLKMKFKDRNSGDILTKDGKLVQRVMDTRTPSSGLQGVEGEEESGNLVISEEFEEETADPGKHRKKPRKPMVTPLEVTCPESRARTSGESAMGTNTSTNQLSLRDFTPNYMLNPGTYPMVSQIQMPASVAGDTRVPMPTQAPSQSDMYLTIDPMPFKYTDYY